MNVPARGTAGGKVILLGEHAVVYGRPALVAGVPRRLTVTLTAGDGPRIESAIAADDERPLQLLVAVARHFGLAPDRLVARVDSELPAGAGFGSSAALVVAMVRAMAAAAGQSIDVPALLRLGRDLEATFHGVSSGVDPAAAALGGCFWYALDRQGQVDADAGQGGDAGAPFFGAVALGCAVEVVVARQVGTRRTGVAVGGVRERWQADRPRYERLFDAVAAVVRDGVAAVRRGDRRALGAAFDENHRVLMELGVSSPATDGLVTIARGAGALGAKLTGGGAGGAMIALVTEAGAVANALRAAGATTDVVRVDPVVIPVG